ncbi:MAG TPA: hypothetical protein VFL81_02675 [Candidatus Saccharimonadales bacterium]|nr:hypothetical protein [Candidatus Saccharimonadales bacterium]
MSKWIHDYDERRLAKVEARANLVVRKTVEDLDVPEDVKGLLREFYFCQHGLVEGRGQIDELDLLERLDRCKLALEEAFRDPEELKDPDERPSTANALGRKALVLTEA